MPEPETNITRRPEFAGHSEALPLSLLNDFLYCPRRAALKVVEGWREANEHTERGDIVHEHADLAGYEVVKGVTLLRALPVWSEALGLSGKCDIVERRADGSLFPVKFKVGRRRQWENDDAQLCAQALCLEEMFAIGIACGAVFHADSKRRREVEFSPALRETTRNAIAGLHGLLSGEPEAGRGALPPAVCKPGCRECSLYEICVPELTGQPGAVERAAARLFET
jgi:CRISPR-associated exonuclease Cas4